MRLKIIETYPAANKNLDTKPIQTYMSTKERMGKYNKIDTKDAYICARIAYLFATGDKAKLNAPPKTISKSEGWIWTLNI